MFIVRNFLEVEMFFLCLQISQKQERFKKNFPKVLLIFEMIFKFVYILKFMLK